MRPAPQPPLTADGHFDGVNRRLVETLESASFPIEPPNFVSVESAGLAAEFTVYSHSSKRAGRRSLIDALMNEGAQLGTAESVVLKGTEGFGATRRVHAEIREGRIPLVAITTVTDNDSASAFTGLLSRLPGEPLVTVAETAILDAAAGPLKALGDAFTQLVVHCRIGAGLKDPAGVGAVIELLRQRGVAGATAVSGGDGFTAGQRHRDGAFARSPMVPALVISIDRARVLATVVPPLVASPHVAMVTAKPIWVWKDRAGVAGTPIAADADGWRSLSVFTADDPHRWRALHTRLIAHLRNAGAAGATVVQGQLAYVRGDSLRPQRRWVSRREAPMITKIVDTRDRVPAGSRSSTN